ncbi:MAG: DUF503 domain-containing protein [Actinomycetota bacterium]|nr:DUF503 domain-containing protein [Actinomycetota bacterium]
MVVGLLRIELFLPNSNSLKEKRHIVKSIIGKVESKYNVSISEVDNHDLWQRVTLGIAHVAETGEQTKKVLDHIDRFIESMDKAIISEREFSLFVPEK